MIVSLWQQGVLSAASRVSTWSAPSPCTDTLAEWPRRRRWGLSAWVRIPQVSLWCISATWCQHIKDLGCHNAYSWSDQIGDLQRVLLKPQWTHFLCVVQDFFWPRARTQHSRPWATRPQNHKATRATALRSAEWARRADLPCHPHLLAPSAAQSQCFPPLAAYGAGIVVSTPIAVIWTRRCSILVFNCCVLLSTKVHNPYASTGNRTRITLMATMYSATRPLMPLIARTRFGRVQMDASWQVLQVCTQPLLIKTVWPSDLKWWLKRHSATVWVRTHNCHI